MRKNKLLQFLGAFLLFFSCVLTRAQGIEPPPPEEPEPPQAPIDGYIIYLMLLGIFYMCYQFHSYNKIKSSIHEGK